MAASGKTSAAWRMAYVSVCLINKAAWLVASKWRSGMAGVCSQRNVSSGIGGSVNAYGGVVAAAKA